MSLQTKIKLPGLLSGGIMYCAGMDWTLLDQVETSEAIMCASCDSKRHIEKWAFIRYKSITFLVLFDRF